MYRIIKKKAKMSIYFTTGFVGYFKILVKNEIRKKTLSRSNLSAGWNREL